MHYKWSPETFLHPFPKSLFLLIRGAVRSGFWVVRDVSVGEELQDPAWYGEGLHLVCGDWVAQDGAAQVAQTGHWPGYHPKPHVAISGPCGYDSPLWMEVAAQPIGGTVLLGLHHHTPLSWLPHLEGSVFSNNGQLQTPGGESQWWDLVLSIHLRAIPIGKKKQQCVN